MQGKRFYRFWCGALCALVLGGQFSALASRTGQTGGQTGGLAHPFQITDLAWLSGDWETAPGSGQIDEHWTRVAGGTLFGMSRTVANNKTVFYEYLRIEARGTDIFYVAHPRGRQPGTDFKLVQLNGQEAVFENLAHDFPKRIRYRKNADGTLTARVEGDGTEKEKPQDYHYRPSAPRS
jgi:hypothetical protein